MPTRYIKRQASLGPGENQRATANTIYMDSDTNTVKVGTGTSGTSENELVDLATAQTITGAKTFTGNVVLTDVSFEIGDDDRLTLGDDNDDVLVHRSATLAANTALTSVLIGTPVTQALAANSLIVSNVTASGDIMVAANRGGASEEYFFADASAGNLTLTGPGTSITFEAGTTVVEVINATSVELEDDIFLALGNDQDEVLLNRSTSLAANTAVTGAMVGTPVAQALAANSLLISNITASGDVMIAANRGGNSEEYFMADSSAGTLTLTAPNGAIGFESGTTAIGYFNSTSAEFEDDILLALGNDQDQVLLNRSGTLAANTALTGVLIGTPVTPALAANSLIVANATSNGDVLVAVNDGGNSKAILWADASADQTRFYSEGLEGILINENQDVVHSGGLSMDVRSSSADATDGDTTYEIAELLTGIVTRSGITANRTDKVDTAANIVAGVPGAVVGTSFFFVVNNNDDASTVTLNGAQTGITYEGTATALAAGDAWLFLAVMTNVTGASEAVTIYQIAK